MVASYPTITTSYPNVPGAAWGMPGPGTPTAVRDPWAPGTPGTPSATPRNVYFPGYAVGAPDGRQTARPLTSPNTSRPQLKPAGLSKAQRAGGRPWMSVRRRRRADLRRSAGAFSSNEACAEFLTWEVTLDGAERVFRQGPTSWNRKYKTAQTFFERTASGAEIRRLFQLEGAALYSGGVEREGPLATDVDLLLGMDFGVRSGVQQVMSYVMYGNTLRYCEAAALVAHCAMAEASEEVWCSGEFIVRHEGGEYSLVLDNNSGTYAPRVEALEALARLLQENFPGLKVESYHFDSVELVQLKKNFNGDPYNIYSGGLSQNPVAEKAQNAVRPQPASHQPAMVTMGMPPYARANTIGFASPYR